MDDDSGSDFGDDLYGDLDPSSGNAPLPPVGSLAYDAMADENAVLRKNISTLWLTAKAEIRRKDREIGRLKEELARLAKDAQHDG